MLTVKLHKKKVKNVEGPELTRRWILDDTLNTMPAAQLPKQEEIMASSNDLSAFVWRNETEIALLELKKKEEESDSIFTLSSSPFV